MGKSTRNIKTEEAGLTEKDFIEEKMTLLNMAIESAGIGTWVFDLAGDKRYFDNNASRLLGFTSTQYKRTAKEFLDAIHPEDREEVKTQFLNLLKNKSDIKTEFRVIWPDGAVKFITAKAKTIKNNKGVPLRVIGLIWDITDQKKVEIELKSSLEQLHKVAQHIEEVRENERVTISRELHDDLGQALTAVKIDLATIKQSVTDMATVLKINKTSALVSDTIKAVQRITSQLRPQIIDDLGLETAIEWYTKEFEQRNRVKVFLDMDSSLKIAPDTSLIIFRILQEALTNISRHSGATSVVIRLTKNKDKLHFSVTDNGVGITEDKINSKKSFGIINMMERAASLGGTFKVIREDDTYTTISVVFPISNK